MKLLLLVLVGVAVEVRSQEGGCTDDAEADASVTKVGRVLQTERKYITHEHVHFYSS